MISTLHKQTASENRNTMHLKTFIGKDRASAVKISLLHCVRSAMFIQHEVAIFAQFHPQEDQ